jgi:hypothetical protein
MVTPTTPAGEREMVASPAAGNTLPDSVAPRPRQGEKSDSPESAAPAAAHSPRELERQLLCALCQGGSEDWLKESARSLLSAYRWSDPTHQALFEIVMSFPAASAAALREQLPARLTRRGFPDFDLELLFASTPPSAAEAEQGMRRLRELA